MLRFILPTLGIWLAAPIMSLVDAGVVGTRNAVELASLGPAQILCESLIYCSTFLAVATTNLQATALAKGDTAEAQKACCCCGWELDLRYWPVFCGSSVKE
ncbi:unnamed protein product [Discosporangium mesarthrocarpum]